MRTLMVTKALKVWSQRRVWIDLVDLCVRIIIHLTNSNPYLVQYLNGPGMGWFIKKM